MKTPYVLLCTLLFASVLYTVYYYSFSRRKSGVIIILNGPSASGKSSIQKELQKIFKKPLLALGLDTFFIGVMPARYWQEPCLETDSDKIVMKGTSSTDEQGPLFELEVGGLGRKIIYGMHRAIAAYAQEGNDVVVDYILYDHVWLEHLKATLRGYKVIFVGVEIDKQILFEREAHRGTSPVGHARSHYDTVHRGMTYDLVVNTGKLTAAECAQVIEEYVQKALSR